MTVAVQQINEATDVLLVYECERSQNGSTLKRHSVGSLSGPTPAALEAAILNWYSVPSMSLSTVY